MLGGTPPNCSNHLGGKGTQIGFAWRVGTRPENSKLELSVWPRGTGMSLTSKGICFIVGNTCHVYRKLQKVGTSLS